MTTEPSPALRRIRACFAWAVVILIPTCFVYSCIIVDNEKRIAAEASVAAETAKFATAELAQAEIERRIAVQVVRNGRTLTVTDPLMHTVYVVPVRSQWVVSCDRFFGLSVKLGSTSPGEDSDAVTVEIIPIKFAKILSEEKCNEIAPMLGNVMIRVTFLPGR